MALALFGLLWYLRKRVKTAGVLFGIYLFVNGLERFFIEKIRINTNYILFGHEITQAEIISVALMLIGIIIVLKLNRKQLKSVQ
jgi:prolipoprotein diacylglyceryltransferase